MLVKDYKNKQFFTGHPTRYRRGAGVVLINKDKKIFIGQRRDLTQVWQLPQGGVDEGETFLNAAYRELFEETGIKKTELIYKCKKWHRYDFPENILGKLWEGKFCGQKQKWFLLLFTGKEDKDINLKAFRDQEFQNWKWIFLDELLEYAAPFKRHIYENLQKEMAPIIERLKIKSGN